MRALLRPPSVPRRLRPTFLTQRTLMEQALNALTLPVTFLRPAWFMENFAWDVVSARDQAAYDTGSLYSPA